MDIKHIRNQLKVAKRLLGAGKQFAVFKGDVLVGDTFTTKAKAVKRAKELLAGGKSAPWAYVVYEIKQVWDYRTDK